MDKWEKTFRVKVEGKTTTNEEGEQIPVYTCVNDTGKKASDLNKKLKYWPEDLTDGDADKILARIKANKATREPVVTRMSSSVTSADYEFTKRKQKELVPSESDTVAVVVTLAQVGLDTPKSIDDLRGGNKVYVMRQIQEITERAIIIAKHMAQMCSSSGVDNYHYYMSSGVGKKRITPFYFGFVNTGERDANNNIVWNWKTKDGVQWTIVDFIDYVDDRLGGDSTLDALVPFIIMVDSETKKMINKVRLGIMHNRTSEYDEKEDDWKMMMTWPEGLREELFGQKDVDIRSSNWRSVLRTGRL